MWRPIYHRFKLLVAVIHRWNVEPRATSFGTRRALHLEMLRLAIMAENYRHCAPRGVRSPRFQPQ